MDNGGSLLTSSSQNCNKILLVLKWNNITLTQNQNHLFYLRLQYVYCLILTIEIEMKLKFPVKLARMKLYLFIIDSAAPMKDLACNELNYKDKYLQ